jgi:hypothetical protein
LNWISRIQKNIITRQTLVIRNAKLVHKDPPPKRGPDHKTIVTNDRAIRSIKPLAQETMGRLNPSHSSSSARELNAYKEAAARTTHLTNVSSRMALPPRCTLT